jgi:hypothetical protein
MATNNFPHHYSVSVKRVLTTRHAGALLPLHQQTLLFN